MRDAVVVKEELESTSPVAMKEELEDTSPGEPGCDLLGSEAAFHIKTCASICL